MNYSEDTSQIVSVWSAYGHKFIGGGGEPESCLTCGAMFQLMAFADDPTSGEYMTSAGDTPMQCTGDTSMEHGYPGEISCGSCDAIEGCEHCRHDCNCLFCDS